MPLHYKKIKYLFLASVLVVEFFAFGRIALAGPYEDCLAESSYLGTDGAKAECCQLNNSCNSGGQYLNYDNCMMVNNYDAGAKAECCKAFPDDYRCSSGSAGYLNYDNCVMINQQESNVKDICCSDFPQEATCKPVTGSNPPNQGATGGNGGNGSKTAVMCEGLLENVNGVCVPKGGPGGGLAGKSTLLGLVLTVIKYMLMLAGLIAVIMVLIGGFFWMTAQGNDEQAEKGRKTLTNAVIGLIVALMAYAIVSIIISSLTTEPGKISAGGTPGPGQVVNGYNPNNVQYDPTNPRSVAP